MFNLKHHIRESLLKQFKIIIFAKNIEKQIVIQFLYDVIQYRIICTEIEIKFLEM